MFGKRCSLCSGKLDSNNVCKECGLDNTKSDKYYKINQSRCDHMPLTHIHEEAEPEKKRNIKKKVKYTYQTQNTKKKQKSSKGKTAIFMSVLSVLIAMIPACIGVFEAVVDSPYPEEVYTDVEEIYTDVEYDPYEYVDKAYEEEGEYLMYSLESGEYTVGVHIPEGIYYATVSDDFDVVQVTDNENGIYLYEYPAKDGVNYLDDLRLFNGAVVTITSETEIIMETDNGQTYTQTNGIENPVKDSFHLESDYKAEAGLDFEAGVYDVFVPEGYGYINLTIKDESGEEWSHRNFEIGKDGEGGAYYRNLVIPEGAYIVCEEADAELIPGEIISSTNYMGYYY